MLNSKMKSFISCFIHLICNSIFNKIPCWWCRKVLYILLGLKIGSGSRISMGCILMNPWLIKIGMNTMVNSNVTLDGRGGVEIGDNCSISYGAVIYSASHHIHTDGFEYYKKRTVIGSGVWIGTYAVVNAGTVIKDNCVLGANSVANASIDFESNGVYVGVPAMLRFYRKGFQGRLNIQSYFL